jgi:hypothetical protein
MNHPPPVISSLSRDQLPERYGIAENGRFALGEYLPGADPSTSLRFAQDDGVF